MTASKIVIKYRSAKNEVSVREISEVSSKIADNGNIMLHAYCHLRDTQRSFNVGNIIEVLVDGQEIDVLHFWRDNIRDKKWFRKDAERVIAIKRAQVDEYVKLLEGVMEYVEAAESPGSAESLAQLALE